MSIVLSVALDRSAAQNNVMENLYVFSNYLKGNENVFIDKQRKN